MSRFDTSLKLRTVSAEFARWGDDFARQGGISRNIRVFSDTVPSKVRDSESTATPRPVRGSRPSRRVASVVKDNGGDQRAKMARVILNLPRKRNAIFAPLHRFVQDSALGSYSYSATRYSYSIRSSATASVRWISRVSIDMIRLKSNFPRRFDSSSMASQTRRTSSIDAHSSVEPRAISKNRFLSLTLCLPFPSAIFSGIDCAACNHWSRAGRLTPESDLAMRYENATWSIESR